MRFRPMVGLVSLVFLDRALRPSAAALPLPANADGGDAISELTAASKLVPRRATESSAARLSAGESPDPAPEDSGGDGAVHGIVSLFVTAITMACDPSPM